MARDIDRVIEFIRLEPSIPPVIKLVLINRIEPEAAPAEIEAAREELYNAFMGPAASAGRLHAHTTSTVGSRYWCDTEGEPSTFRCRERGHAVVDRG